jgi:hypothetical protein
LAALERDVGQPEGLLDQPLDGRILERVMLEFHMSYDAPGAGQAVLGIRDVPAPHKEQCYPSRKQGDREDGERRFVAAAESDDESVVVVLDHLGSPGESPT